MYIHIAYVNELLYIVAYCEFSMFCTLQIHEKTHPKMK